MPLVVLIFLFLLFSPVTLLAEADSLEQASSVRSVALPGMSAYTGVGLSVGLGGGIFSPIEDCDCMGSWQAQLEYFYSPRLSGGLEARFFGGNLDRDVMLIYQRYIMNVRFHMPLDNFDIFMSPFLGFETTDFSAFRKQVLDRKQEAAQKQLLWWQRGLADSLDVDTVDVEVEDEHCQKAFTMDGFTVGSAIGMGYNLSRYFALTGLVQVEYNFSDDVILNIVPGVAFNLREIWPWAKRTLLSNWISFEIGGQRNFNRDVKGWSNTFFLGLQLGA